MKRKMEVYDGKLYVQFGQKHHSAFHAPVADGMRHFMAHEQEDVFTGRVPKACRKAWKRLKAGKIQSLPLNWR